MASKISAMSPSGQIVDVVCGNEVAVLGVNSSFLVTTGKTSRAFMIGRRGYHDRACEVMIEATPVWRGYVSGREVIASATADNSVLVATLLGPYHELMTVFADGRPAEESVLRVFSALRVTDGIDGMSVRPRTSASSAIAWEDLSIVVGDRGLLHIPYPGASRPSALVPAWAGAPTQHGEIWRHPSPDGPADSKQVKGGTYLLGCPRGVAEVHVNADTTASDEEILDWLDGLDVSWR